jgi:hypothetical protein
MRGAAGPGVVVGELAGDQADDFIGLVGRTGRSPPTQPWRIQQAKLRRSWSGPPVSCWRPDLLSEPHPIERDTAVAIAFRAEEGSAARLMTAFGGDPLFSKALRQGWIQQRGGAGMPAPGRHFLFSLSIGPSRRTALPPVVASLDRQLRRLIVEPFRHRARSAAG